jgi:Tol biopolymer transport system component/plastocyanin
MTTSATVALRLAALGLLVTLAGCSEAGGRIAGPTERELTTILSDPAPSPSSAALAGSIAHQGPSVSLAAATPAVGAVSEVAYVSLPPGTAPEGVAATVRNERTGSSVMVAVVDGGFDPVPVGAQAGDALEVTVANSVGATVHATLERVPARRSPRVVRTVPPRGKTDVPLNARIIVVFSEPIDPATLSSEAVQLRLRVGGTRLAVPGRLEFRDTDRLTAVLVPERPLVRRAGYELVVTTAIRDVDGDGLEEPVTVQFTTGTAADALGPNLIAFTRYGDAASGEGNGDIYVVNADGTGLRRLTNSQNWGSWGPSWSPDGKRIAFVSELHKTVGEPRNPFSEPRIYVMNADGSGITKLTQDWWGEDQSPAWSPDGGRIAFARGECLESDATAPQRRCTVIANGAIYVMNADGSAVTRLVDGYTPSWSPDGSKIAFVKSSAVYVMNDDGSGVTRLTTTPAFTWRPAWSPDGTRIAFAGGPDESTKSDLYVINSDGSGLRRLTLSGGESPSWSPDGSKIVYVGVVPCPWYIPGCNGIFVTNADGSSPATYLGLEGNSPAWYPPGTVAPRRPSPTISLQMIGGDNGDGQADTVLSTLAAPFRVQVLRDGAPAQRVDVSWKIRRSADGGSLSTSASMTDASGVAAATLTLGSRARGYVVEASVAGAAGSPVVFGAGALPGNPIGLARGGEGHDEVWRGSGDQQVGRPGERLRSLYVVRSFDSHENAVKSVAIEWAVVSGGGSVFPLGPPVGPLAATHLLGPELGPQTVTATAPAIPGAPQVTFTAAAANAVVDLGTHDLSWCQTGFEPSELTVPAGSTVAWGWIYCINEDENGMWSPLPHDLTFEDDPTEPVSSRVKNGGYHLRTFAAPGTYRFRCTLHSTSYGEGEVGTVTVR